MWVPIPHREPGMVSLNQEKPQVFEDSLHDTSRHTQGHLLVAKMGRSA